MKFKNNQIFYLIAFAITIIILVSPFATEIGFARPGGGHSFSGGGGSSGGGGGGGGDGIGFLIYLLFTELPPQVSIPIIIIIIGLRIYLKRRNRKESGTVTSSPGIAAKNEINSNVENDIQALKSADPNFSKVLFLDFASSLYNKYYAYYGKPEFNNLSPYFDNQEIIQSKNLKNNQSINEIVIGSIRISEIKQLQDVTGIAVDIEANYTLEINTKKTRYYTNERWYFNRKAGLLSQEPEKLRKLACPVCGAPLNFSENGVCQNCGTQINNGNMLWFVKKHVVLNQEIFTSKGLGQYAEEMGTGLQTIYQSNLNYFADSFATRHQTDWNTWRTNFANTVVGEYFQKIYEAWSKNNLGTVRNLISDRLYDSFMFWISAYKSEGLSNRLENIKISNIQFVKIDTDQYYESVTVRIYATCNDYVIDKTGNIRGGSAKKPRSFSEYWTFMRRNGVEKDQYDYSTCPNCGAPADKMGQAGVCEYCGTKISNGDFSWVLAIITQDEVYYG
jgi:predicted lipid-binding transport protein (Tim44 family)